MNSNDFAAASALLADTYELVWPQSSERIVGRENFTAVNTHYPAHGPWSFTINRLIAQGDEAVSDVSVSDGVVQARVITFSTVRDGQITAQTEFWPDSFAAADWRRAWVQVDSR
jgi:ketosteroid isomerase-like protein